MKSIALGVALIVAPLVSNAQPLDRWDATGGVIRVENQAGGRNCSSTAAVSYTVPNGASYVRFDPPVATNFQVCLENTADAVCGTSAPTTSSSSTNVWADNPVTRRLTAKRENASESYRPNLMWVQNSSGSGCAKWHWNSGE